MTRDALDALRRAGFSRRDFLKTSGALIVTFSSAAVLERTGLAQGQFGTRISHVDPSKLDSWIAIAADGTVTAYTGKCELGQGIFTVQTQLVAEELSVPIARVRLIQCDPAVTPVARLDMPAMATGQFEFVHNVRVPGMVHGAVVRPPTVGATLGGVDETSVRGMPGFIKVVANKNFVGVVCEKPWQAMQAARALKATWTPGPALPAQAGFHDYLRKQPSRDAFLVNSGDVDQALGRA